MEYGVAVPSDQYCESRRLSSNERLKLFRVVCGAVQYAHQNLVVHRDLKPSNIFVTADGTPKVLDFGIAKLLNPESAAQTVLTQPEMRPMTLDYASPEQFHGHPVTTSSDIYSLGVVLYELLTGQHPFELQQRSPVEMEHIISEVQPDKPSVAVRQMKAAEGRHLRGDLDNIVLMALRKEPQRRYASVEQLSEDIARHLANLPVMARPDTRTYRAAKFLARNKAWVAMAASVFLLAAAGVTATVWEAHIARQERDRARLEQVKSTRINAFLQEMVGYSGITGGANHSHDATVAEMLDDAAERVQTELVDQPEVRAELLGTIGGTYMNRV